jgi:molybdopterin synthase catalytic subunit
MSSLIPSASTSAKVETAQSICVLTYDSLDVNTVISAVGDDRAGANAVFIGTTRNSFEGGLCSDLTYLFLRPIHAREICHSVRISGV